jgi:hypothetical protein
MLRAELRRVNRKLSVRGYVSHASATRAGAERRLDRDLFVRLRKFAAIHPEPVDDALVMRDEHHLELHDANPNAPEERAA